MVTRSHRAKWKEFKDDPDAHLCPFCGEVDTSLIDSKIVPLPKTFENSTPSSSNGATEKLPRDNPIQFGQGSLQTFSHHLQNEPLVNFPVSTQRDDPIWVWTDGSA